MCWHLTQQRSSLEDAYSQVLLITRRTMTSIWKIELNKVDHKLIHGLVLQKQYSRLYKHEPLVT
jgi:hypothetical protein